MKEVAAVIFRVLFEAGARAGIPAERLAKDVQHKQELLSWSRPRYPWSDYVAVIEELALALGGYERFMHAAGAMPDLVPPEVTSVFRVFVSPRAVYRFVFNVLDPLVLPMIRSSCKDAGDGRLCVSYELEEGYPESPAWAWGSLGALGAVPGYIGQGRAEVEVIEFSARHGVFLVTPPPSRTLLARTTSSVPWLISRVLRELGEEQEQALTHSTLAATVAQLEEQTAALAHHIAQRESTEQTLRRVLNSVAGAAFYAGATDVVPANELGGVALAAEGEALRRAVLEACKEPDATHDFMVVAAGVPDKRLVMRRGAAAEMERRMHSTAQRWRLSPQQRNVLRALVEGRTNAEIAAQLDCTQRTVETHVTALLQRSGASSRLALVAVFWSHS